MCGIVGYTGNKQAAVFLLNGLEKLEYRGYDSAGVAVLSDGEFQIRKTEKRISDLREITGNGSQVQGNVGIGHTRWATHGAPTVRNAHPHLSSDGKFAVVHNGIIENYRELKKELREDGFEFQSETDTEVIPMLLQKYYAGDLFDAVSKTVSRLKGSYALGILCADHPKTLVAVRFFSPLIVGISDEGKYIASDIMAIAGETDRVMYIEDGEIAVLTPLSAKVYDREKNELKREINKIDTKAQSIGKAGYDHFMMKEMNEQPTAVRQTLFKYISDREIVFEGLKLNDRMLKNIKRIDVVACGSAYHAGIVGKNIFEQLLRIPTSVELASEYRYGYPITGPDVLTIVISQSGETADSLAALSEAKRKRSHTLAIVNVVSSSIAKNADDVIYTLAGPEIAVATTKGYTTQLSVLYLFAIYAAKILHTADEKRLDSLFDELCVLPEKMQKVIDRRFDYKKIAEKIGDPESLFFIGRNLDYAVALEASLKLKEISYIHSEAYAAGELKHGTISLIEEGRTVFALSCCSEMYKKTLSNVKEVMARGARVVSCSTENYPDTFLDVDELITVPETDPLLIASLEILPFQFCAYYSALRRGCDIDKPRNLAKSVTVE